MAFDDYAIVGLGDDRALDLVEQQAVRIDDATIRVSGFEQAADLP